MTFIPKRFVNKSRKADSVDVESVSDGKSSDAAKIKVALMQTPQCIALR